MCIYICKRRAWVDPGMGRSSPSFDSLVMQIQPFLGCICQSASLFMNLYSAPSIYQSCICHCRRGQLIIIIISCHCLLTTKFMIILFADKVIHHNPRSVPFLLAHALPDLNHNKNDHNTKQMEL